MSAVTATRSQSPVRHWIVAAGVAGIAWNLFGAYQFVGSATATVQDLVAAGLTQHQAEVMTSYPFWMTISFAVGVFGGLAGSLLLALKHAYATPVLAVSLAAYVALWIGDAVNGVFAAMGTPQIVIITVVVAIAAALLTISRLPATKA
ncbi:MAG: hypothetical protein KDJ66_13580 [Nitratireductor sp.]|nr:hypothetical protein [Nitratireductor sp.]MCB1455089.1 hypothetical protein [Nitratireductor sp.]